ncbi:MAG: hypothetical protein COU46_03495 [Candidatus Niyogibacteria bacterium CG10_big_fil_rev_8_21_14_0_10_42_19]|uniref:Uncharacterized protein n=1 Tax=Candidatus Niyogibacteria bacterium CG10_big_fil_rev_8_21_14_0_10_42_19 TaxID=1974725 RepID=A0A2H0TES5_9BACT|nr:MAG: hypothetical protein COU46_03495 [Candidatus Niyogibacteria bacterium CG10_big_fil_rev_8_21_14_0_10_42_19]
MEYAVASSTYYATTSIAEAHVNGQTINSEVVYIDDDGTKANIGNTNTNFTGSLVKIGNPDLTGGVFNSFGNFATIVVYGNLKISGNTTINGIVYVTGETSFGGGTNTINGSLISAGGTSVTDLTGNATINFDPTVYASWQDITGLNTTSTESPRVVGWTEE